MKYFAPFFIFLIFTVSSVTAQSYNMDNTDETTCSGIFYDSGGSGDNIVLGMCLGQCSYSNNEDYEKTFCSDNGQSLMFLFDVLDIVGTDYLNVYDGASAADPLIANITSGSALTQLVSSGTCLTFVFHSNDNGTEGFLTECDDGGNWSASISCVDVYYIDDPLQENTCSGVFVDDGGIAGDYSENGTWTKTFCPGGTGTCVKLNFSMLDLGTGETLTFYNGTSATGTPLMTLTNGDPIPVLGVSSDDGQCLTVKFVTDGDGNTGAGFQASIFCPPDCGTPPECVANPDADDQCITATPICNLDGFCGNTYPTYTNIDHNGENWNNVSGLMDDFCGSIENNSWLSFIAEASVATLNVWTFNCANSQGIQMQVYATTDCEDFIPMSNCVSEGFPSDFTIEAVGLTPGETYYLMIDGFAGDNCDFIIAAGSGIDVGAEITMEQTICLDDWANISVDVANPGTTTFQWSASPADPTLSGQESLQTIIVSPTDTTTYYCQITGPSANPLCGPINETLETMVNVLDPSHPYCNLDVNCWVSASGSDAVICLGDFVTVWANGSVDVSLLANDFNDGTAGINWSSTTAATFNNPCGTGPDAIYLWMGDVSPAPRNLTSTDFDVTYGGTLAFFLRYSVQADGTPCEGPDEPDEGVSLQYSINNGSTWVDIAYFNPSTAAIEAFNPGGDFPSATGPTAFTSWNWYTFPIPAGAQSPSTRFRWIQTASTTLQNDHWGIDSILITTPPPDVEFNWTSIPVGYNETGQYPPADTPAVSTYYIVEVSATVDGAPYSCTDTIFVEVMEVETGFNVNDPDQCLEVNNFSFTNTGSTGSGYQYSWDFGDTGTSSLENPTHTYSSTGTFTVTQTVTYNGNCGQQYSMTVTVFEATAGFNVNNSVQCLDGNSFSFTNTGSTGAGYQYSWDFGGEGSSVLENPSFSFTDAGTYTITQTVSYNGYCDETSIVTVTVNDATAGFTVNDPDQCFLGNSFSFINLGSGGADYVYSWNFGGDGTSALASPIHSFTLFGTYNVTQSVGYDPDHDGTGECTETYSMPVTIFNDPVIQSITANVENCYNDCNGSLQVNVSGTPPFSFGWSDNQGQTTQTAINLCSGIYYIIVTDANGCSATSFDTLPSRPALLITGTSTTQVTCFGYQNGMAGISITGGTGSGTYNYQWDAGTGSQVTAVAGNLFAGNYMVTVTDFNGCTVDTNVIVSQPDAVVITVINPDIICSGMNTVINANAQGGNGVPYTYYWIDNTLDTIS
ncbi:MAG: PKD domain-containing protein, partial [Bacteroidetes bacterium]|nr:PKD domain-containing protein [Bacteroidota bacterium]